MYFNAIGIRALLFSMAGIGAVELGIGAVKL
jgi:hypothetical protein